MNGQIVELINVGHEVTWLPWAVQYFFLIGLSVGALLLTLPAFVLRKSHLEPMGRVALLVALACAIAAGLALISDLHQPFRFFHFYLYFQPNSWMAWGAFFLPGYVVLLLAYAWLIYRPGFAQQATASKGFLAGVYRLVALGGGAAPRAVRFLGGMALLAAALVVVYTGSEVAVVRARPLWNTPFVPLLFLTTAIGGAAGVTWLVSRRLAPAGSAERNLLGVMHGALVATLLLALGWLGSGLAGYAPGEAVLRLASEYRPLTFVGLWLVLCAIVPLAMVFARVAPAVAAALTVAGAWQFRWEMFIGGQQIPKAGAGFNAYHLPLGHEGLLGMAGTLGLWLLLLLIFTTFLPWRANPGSAR